MLGTLILLDNLELHWVFSAPTITHEKTQHYRSASWLGHSFFLLMKASTV